MSKRFSFLTGDINWKDYGGKFYHKEETYTGSGEYIYTIIDVINMQDACGSDARTKYAVEVKTICTDVYSKEQIAHALEYCGWEPEEITPLMTIEAMHSYGYGDLECSLVGNNIKKLLKEARQYI